MRWLPESAARPRGFTRPARAAALAGLILCGANAAAADTEGEAKPPPVPAESIDRIGENQVVSVLGLAARGADGKQVGRIIDVMVDKTGQPRAAVIDVGGFLGMGTRKVAVDWAALHFSLGKDAVAILSIPSDQIKAAPAYDPAKPVEAIGRPEPAPPPEPAAAAKP